MGGLDRWNPMDRRGQSSKGPRTGSITFLSVALFLAVIGSQAQTGAACIERAIELDLEAKLSFQLGLHDLIVAARPEFAELAGISRDLQVALSRSRSAKLAYLLRHDAGRLRTDSGVSAFSNFAWSDRDEAAFNAESPDHAAMTAEIERLRQANDGHPDWDTLRAFVRSDLSSMPAFQTLAGDLRANLARIEEVLVGCGAP